jgi:hypothetical protein
MTGHAERGTTHWVEAAERIGDQYSSEQGREERGGFPSQSPLVTGRIAVR